MPLPEFTDDEKYLINFVKSSHATGHSYSYMWSYILTGAVIAGFAAYFHNILIMFVAFAIVCGYRIYEEYYQRRWLPMWRSIIDKYEAAAADDALIDTSQNDGSRESSVDA